MLSAKCQLICLNLCVLMCNPFSLNLNVFIWQPFCFNLNILSCPYQAQVSDPFAPDPISLVNIHTLGQFTVSTTLPLNPPGAVFTQVADTYTLDSWSLGWRMEKMKSVQTSKTIKWDVLSS